MKLSQHNEFAHYSILSNKRQKEIEKWVRRIAYFVVGLWIVFPFLAMWISEVDKRGQFGDSYGMITSLFTGVTIIGLVYTILLQQEDISIARSSLQKQHDDLELNRDQMELNRTELQLTRIEFKRQNRTIKYQRFENTFFRLLEFYRDLDRQKFKYAYENYVNHLPNAATYEDALSKYRRDVHIVIKDQLSDYVKSFEAIVRFIDDNKSNPASRDEDLPVGFCEFQPLFDDLHMTSFMPKRSCVIVTSATISKKQQETMRERRSRLKKLDVTI